jgi:hypothetical protein
MVLRNDDFDAIAKWIECEAGAIVYRQPTLAGELLLLMWRVGRISLNYEWSEVGSFFWRRSATTRIAPRSEFTVE